MSTVLVAYASRMGSTREIAAAIANELAQLDHTVTVASCAEAPDVDGFDAVVIGSAIYVQRWIPDAVRYLRRQAPYLTNRPTYLFQSGPCDTSKGVDGTPSPRSVRRITRKFGLSEPTTFAGRLDPARATGRLTRWVATGSNAGDFRHWSAVRDWAYTIGTDIQAFAESAATYDDRPSHSIPGPAPRLGPPGQDVGLG